MRSFFGKLVLPLIYCLLLRTTILCIRQRILENLQIRIFMYFKMHLLLERIVVPPHFTLLDIIIINCMGFAFVRSSAMLLLPCENSLLLLCWRLEYFLLCSITSIRYNQQRQNKTRDKISPAMFADQGRRWIWIFDIVWLLWFKKLFFL